MNSPRLIVVVAVGCVVTLVGCASSSASGGTPSASSGALTTEHKQQSVATLVPASIAATGTLRVGVALGSPPDEFQDQSNTVVGWEVDMVRAAAQTMGLPVTFVQVSFDSLIPGLQAGRFDAAIGQLGVTTAREKIVDFVTTLQSDEQFAARSNSSITVANLTDLCGHSVAVARGSREYDFAQTQSSACTKDGKQAVTVGVFDTDSAAVLSLTSGRSDLYWSGATAVSYYVKNSNGLTKVVGSYLKPNPIGTALPKNSGLTPALRAAVQRLMDDGTYRKIVAKWGLGQQGISKAEMNPALTGG
jgi:polar amino acid transport system substrate-binding protein